MGMGLVWYGMLSSVGGRVLLSTPTHSIETRTHTHNKVEERHDIMTYIPGPPQEGLQADGGRRHARGPPVLQNLVGRLKINEINVHAC